MFFCWLLMIIEELAKCLQLKQYRGKALLSVIVCAIGLPSVIKVNCRVIADILTSSSMLNYVCMNYFWSKCNSLCIIHHNRSLIHE